jgi:hypothetical protein
LVGRGCILSRWSLAYLDRSADGYIITKPEQALALSLHYHNPPASSQLSPTWAPSNSNIATPKGLDAPLTSNPSPSPSIPVLFNLSLTAMLADVRQLLEIPFGPGSLTTSHVDCSVWMVRCVAGELGGSCHTQNTSCLLLPHQHISVQDSYCFASHITYIQTIYAQTIYIP